ncbi:MAG: Rid family detoxifying hydrolase [Gammaproteobacteria bacterium]|nr:Rid family detoxifying hydrolase [Gammaproteobacteria bacterium]
MQSYAIDSKHAPEPIGPYSHMVRVGDMLYLSGQIALIPDTMELNAANTETEVRQVFKNIEAVLKAGGADLNDIVKLTVFITDLEQFNSVNVVMSELLSPPYPARSTVQVAALPRNATVEVEAIAVAK